MQKTLSLRPMPTRFCSLLLLAFSLSLQFASDADAQSIGAGTAAQITGKFVTVAPGTSLASVLLSATPNTTFILGSGNYTVRPSFLNSNLVAGNQFTGISFHNKTNITIQGVPGRSIIDGSGSLGELMWISNCSNIKILGVTFKAYTNHNIAQLPPTGLWASVNVYQCEKVEFRNCAWMGSTDHGLQDKGAEATANHGPSTASISTNGMIVENCYFYDIGGWRNNAGTVYVEGTAIVPTGWTIRNCSFENCMRGIEPYNQGDTEGIVFRNCIIQGNSFLNIADQAICTAGSTNGHEIIVANNFFDEETSWSYHGTNLATVGFNSAPGYSIALVGGNGHQIINNTINRARYAAVALGYGTEDCTIDGNKVRNVGNGVHGYGYLLGNPDVSVKPVKRLIFQNNSSRLTTTIGLYILGARDCVFRNNQIETGTVYGGSPAVKCHAFSPNLNTNLTFSGLTVLDTSGTMGYGVEITAGNVNVSFFDCDIRQGTLGKYDNQSGAEVTISGPPKTFTTTVDLASIPASGQRIGNFSAPGVRTNDLVSLMLPSQFFSVGNVTNVSVTAWASNSTTLDGVIFYNIKNLDTVSAADAQNVRFRATVRQVEGY